MEERPQLKMINLRHLDEVVGRFLGLEMDGEWLQVKMSLGTLLFPIHSDEARLLTDGLDGLLGQVVGILRTDSADRPIAIRIVGEKEGRAIDEQKAQSTSITVQDSRESEASSSSSAKENSKEVRTGASANPGCGEPMNQGSTLLLGIRAQFLTHTIRSRGLISTDERGKTISETPISTSAPDTPEVRAKGLGCGRSGLETVCRSQFSEVGLNGRAEAPW